VKPLPLTALQEFQKKSRLISRFTSRKGNTSVRVPIEKAVLLHNTYDIIYCPKFP